MAIVKASYTRNGSVAKAATRYIENRHGKDGRRIVWPTDVATARYVEERCGRQSAYAHQTTEQQGHTSEGRSE